MNFILLKIVVVEKTQKKMSECKGWLQCATFILAPSTQEAGVKKEKIIGENSYHGRWWSNKPS